MPKDFIQLLTEDHRKVRELIDRLENTEETSQRQELCNEIDKELRVHARIEEEIVYPAIREAGDQDIKDQLDESLEEHQEAEDLLDQLAAEDIDSDAFEGLVESLEQALEHHIEEEEDDLFDKCQELFTREERQRIGDEAEARKKQLLEEDLEKLRQL